MQQFLVEPAHSKLPAQVLKWQILALFPGLPVSLGGRRPRHLKPGDEVSNDLELVVTIYSIALLPDEVSLVPRQKNWEVWGRGYIGARRHVRPT